MPNTYAFIDESGSPSLSEPGRYVITAVVCREDQLAGNIDRLNAICGARCNGAQLKSSRTGSNAQIRRAILEDVSSLDIWVYGICVNKDLVHEDSGLRLRGSMYKFCQRKIFERIYRHMESIEVIADTFGRSEFMDSFEKYIDRHFADVKRGHRVWTAPRQIDRLEAWLMSIGRAGRYGTPRLMEQTSDCTGRRRVRCRPPVQLRDEFQFRRRERAREASGENEVAHDPCRNVPYLT
jgi:hypothetical protein